MALSPVRTSSSLNVMLACLSAMTLAACEPQPLKPISNNGIYAPQGFDRRSEAVDGMIVGHRLMDAGQYELALKAYQRAGVERGLDLDVLSGIGSANLALGRLGQAEDLLRRAVDLDENHVPAWNNLGVTLMEQGKFGEAERTFRIAFALDSGQSAEIRDNLRLALAKLRNPEYIIGNESNFSIIRRGKGGYLLTSTN